VHGFKKFGLVNLVFSFISPADINRRPLILGTAKYLLERD
jgi:hypothetical protein